MGVSNHSSIQINKPREAIVQLACTMILAVICKPREVIVAQLMILAVVYPDTPQLAMVYLDTPHLWSSQWY